MTKREKEKVTAIEMSRKQDDTKSTHDRARLNLSSLTRPRARKVGPRTKTLAVRRHHGSTVQRGELVGWMTQAKEEKTETKTSTAKKTKSARRKSDSGKSKRCSQCGFKNCKCVRRRRCAGECGVTFCDILRSATSLIFQPVPAEGICGSTGGSWCGFPVARTWKDIICWVSKNPGLIVILFDAPGGLVDFSTYTGPALLLDGDNRVFFAPLQVIADLDGPGMSSMVGNEPTMMALLEAAASLAGTTTAGPLVIDIPEPYYFANLRGNLPLLTITGKRTVSAALRWTYPSAVYQAQALVLIPNATSTYPLLEVGSSSAFVLLGQLSLQIVQSIPTPSPAPVIGLLPNSTLVMLMLNASHLGPDVIGGPSGSNIIYLHDSTSPEHFLPQTLYLGGHFEIILSQADAVTYDDNKVFPQLVPSPPDYGVTVQAAIDALKGLIPTSGSASGTWTPTASAVTPPGMNIDGSTTGSWTRVGSVVHASVVFQWQNNTGGVVNITTVTLPLPFTGGTNTLTGATVIFGAALGSAVITGNDVTLTSPALGLADTQEVPVSLQLDYTAV